VKNMMSVDRRDGVHVGNFGAANNWHHGSFNRR
jgi:hypothetical protein